MISHIDSNEIHFGVLKYEFILVCLLNKKLGHLMQQCLSLQHLLFYLPYLYLGLFTIFHCISCTLTIVLKKQKSAGVYVGVYFKD